MPPPPDAWSTEPPTMIPPQWGTPGTAPFLGQASAAGELTVDLQLSTRQYRGLHRRVAAEDNHLSAGVGFAVAVVTVVLFGLIGLTLLALASLAVKRCTGSSLIGERPRPPKVNGRIAQQWSFGPAGFSFTDAIGTTEVAWSSVAKARLSDAEIALVLKDQGGCYVLSQQLFPPEALDAVVTHTRRQGIRLAHGSSSGFRLTLGALAGLALLLIIAAFVATAGDNDDGPFGRTCGPGEILVVTSSGSYCA